MPRLLLLCSVLAAVVVAGVAAQEAFGATTTIDGVDVKWEFSDSKGNDYRWSMPVTTYENLIVESRYHVRDKMNLNLDGETVRVVSLDGFVKRSFTKVIGDIYDNSYSNSDFIREVWYIVSQLTVYDEDIHEYSKGRYALETLTRGGGDCEDLVILVADMLLSSKHTDDWTIQYLVMDSNNPANPQEINHVILYVNDGEYYHYVEATAPPNWDYYEKVRGWYLDIVPYTNELDFSGQDLRWMDFTQRDFSDAILVDANMYGADMSFADLREADLSWADLQEVDLYGAYLEDANLAYADLRNADLRMAYLGGADLTGADLRGADLFNAYLGGADLRGADLTGVDLRNTVLRDANLFGATMSEANLFMADLRGADLSLADLTDANLRHTHLREASLLETYMYGADLFMTNLGGAYLDGAYLYDANLRGSNLWGASLYGANLYGANLYGADLGEADLREANMDEADVGRVNWYGTLE